MNETLINLLKQNRVQKVAGERGRGKKIPSGTVVYEELSQEEQQPDPLRQCNNLAKPSKIEKCADWVQCDICDEYICPKSYDKRQTDRDRDRDRQRQRETERDRKRQRELSANDDFFFFCSICIGS